MESCVSYSGSNTIHGSALNRDLNTVSVDTGPNEPEQAAFDHTSTARKIHATSPGCGVLDRILPPNGRLRDLEVQRT